MSPGDVPLDSAAFQAAFNEPLAEVLNLESWRRTRDPAEEYRRIEAEVQLALTLETEAQRWIRERCFPRLVAENSPPGAGLHQVTPREIFQTQRGLLLTGAVEACDGTNQIHDTLPLTIHQIGIALVSYRGERDSLHTRLFRRDVRTRNPDPEEMVLELLEQRSRRGSLDHSTTDALSELAQRGLMSYAERALLTNRSTAPWRMGHGSPAPMELITNYFTDLVVESIRVIRQLIEHARFVFVASSPRDRGLLTLGQGLHPLEYIIVGTLRDRLMPFLDDWTPTHPATVDLTWDGAVLPVVDWIRRLRDELAPRVVYGLYRATPLAPPQLFYAHVDHSAVAARIALADSVTQEERGFPLLIDLADQVCHTIYGDNGLRDVARSVYAAGGAPFRYQSERPTRPE